MTVTVTTRLQKNAERIRKTESDLDTLRHERDQLVAEARGSGVKYADISETTGMSISWINSSLLRSGGHRPRAGRPRRASKT